jgi:hypothetical protein
VSGREDVREILADAMAFGERLGGPGVAFGGLGIEAEAFANGAVEAVETVERRFVGAAHLGGEGAQAIVGLRQGRRPHEDGRWQFVRRLADQAGAILGQHPAGDGHFQRLDRPIDVSMWKMLP